MLDRIKQFANKLFGKGVHEKGTRHFERIIYWIKQ